MNETTSPQPTPAVQDVTGARIVAGIIDVILLAILFIVMSAIFGESESGDGGFSANLSGAPFLLYILLSFGYYFVMEWKLGQTVGKKLLNIKVASLDGQPLAPGQVALRTMLRIIDGLPFLYIVGLICIIASKQKQRIGDMAARTVVVKA